MTDDGLRGSWKGPAPTEEELEQERRELEAAGWEYVEESIGKTFWKNPDSGYLYPQDAAITIVRGVNVADDGGW